MDYLNKLKSTVSTTVSQLSGVLPGNPVTREYEVGKQIGSAGPDLLWKIYSGFKKSTKQEAAIFVLEKKLLDKYSKRDKDLAIEIFSKGVAQLTRLRHPQILTVQHSLEESRESLAFATEPVFASLANILGHHDNIPVPVPSQLKEHSLFDVEIKYGLQQLIEGLIFLHNDVKLLHGNLCPESIIVNQQGAWKIFGFDFCVTNQNPQESKSWLVKEPDRDIPSISQANLDYLAPEVGVGKRLGGTVNTINCRSSADMYSLGCVIISIYQKGNSPWRMEGDVDQFYRHAASNPLVQRLDGIPTELSDYVRSLTHPGPEQRPDGHQLVKISFFDDVAVKTLNYLDSLFQWDNLQKSQFYKGLPQILPRLPHRVCLHRVMPCMATEFVNASMVPFILPCAMQIAQDATKENFVAHILPYLKPVMKIQEPIQILLIFMQRMELLLQKTPPDDVKTDVLPMVYRALEAESSAQIQELCLTIIPSFASLVDYPAMKNALLPRIKKLCLNTSQLSVRVNCLLCIGKLLDNVDKWLVLDDVLPMLPAIPSKDPAVIMGILGVYKMTLEHERLGIPKEVIASQIIPFLFPLCVEPGLSLQQFRSLMATIREMMQRVEEEQKSKLENVAAMQAQHRSAMNLTMGCLPNDLESKPSITSPTNVSSNGVSNDVLFGMNGAKKTTPAQPLDSLLSKNCSLSDTGLTANNKMTSVSAMPAVKPTLASWASPPTPAHTPAHIPAPTPAPATQTGRPRDAVTSMMQSNLSEMRMTPPMVRPLNAQTSVPYSWNSGAAVPGNSMSWNSMLPQQQPTHMAHMTHMSPSTPTMGQFQSALQSPVTPLNLQQSAAPVRALARADIDDLLS